MLCITPRPRVSARKRPRKPIRPRAGTSYSRRTRPLAWVTIVRIRPLRAERSSPTVPIWSCGISTTRNSIGSWIVEVRDGRANFDIIEAGNHHDVTGARLGEFDPLEPLPSVEPRDLAHRSAAVVPA